MRSTRHSWFFGIFLFVLVLAVPSLFGQELTEPYQNVYISYSLEEFDRMLQSGEDQSLDPDALFLISATVTSISVLENTPESLYVDLELMDARWADSRTLRTYIGYAVILQPSFAQRLSESASDNSLPGILAPQSKALFLMQYYGPTETPAGELAPVFIIVDFRKT